jgi:hypothetical protein
MEGGDVLTYRTTVSFLKEQYVPLSWAGSLFVSLAGYLPSLVYLLSYFSLLL